MTNVEDVLKLENLPERRKVDKVRAKIELASIC